jgi:hypothetical protein
VRLGASAAGSVVALDHDYFTATSIYDDYEEECGEAHGGDRFDAVRR